MEYWSDVCATPLLQYPITPLLQHSSNPSPRAFDEKAKEKDRLAAPPVADQPLHAGESLGESLFPRQVEAALAETAE
jgi:hypothetical protein